ncbi:hypothetical protein MHTCC0001_13610 [Flavobacteriaceae bacterium MHTCC 0001]
MLRYQIITTQVILILLVFYVGSAQQDIWIDKNENENYVARHECSFVQAGDKFIMFGGREKSQQLDIYDFKTNTWSMGGRVPKEFNHFQATFYEGFVWVIGSFKTNTFPKEQPADYVWLYYPPTQSWIQGPEIPKTRRRGGAGLVIYNDKFYVVGGNTIGHSGGFVNWFDAYDPYKNTWVPLQSAPNARDHFSALVYQNKLYALGGRHSGGKGGFFAPLVADVDVYDFTTGSWSSLNKPLPTPRAAPGVALFNKELFVMGGEGEKPGPAYKLVEAYSLKTNTWINKANMHYPRHGTQAIRCGKGIYIAGGSPNRGGGRQLNMEVYSKDAPKGSPLIASYLDTPDVVCIKPNSKKIIKLKPSKGNTGIFISDIILKDEDTSKFKLNSNVKHILINERGILNLEIENLDNTIGNVSEIEILFNGTQKKSIQLLSK